MQIIQQAFCCLPKKHPEKYKIHLVLDNANYHKKRTLEAFYKNLGRK